MRDEVLLLLAKINAGFWGFGGVLQALQNVEVRMKNGEKAYGRYSTRAIFAIPDTDHD